jgi:hypothetical protein
MYINENTAQMTLKGFYAPFAERLSSENRWVKLSEKMPWDKIEEEYLKNIDPNNGRPAMSSRLAFGACFIRSAENITDERTVQAIAENPYMQYYLGLKEFDPEPLFDSSMMVHFRKRFPVNFVANVNEYLCTGKWPEDSRNVDRDETETNSDDNENNDDDNENNGGTPSIELEPEEKDYDTTNNEGHLIMDATVAPANIKYPTDIDLLNKSREHLEKAISIYWERVPQNGHMLPYNKKKARKSYLKLSKSKKWTKKKVRKAISEQLYYIELAIQRLNELKNMFKKPDQYLPAWLLDRLEVIPKVYAQQKEMFDNNTHSCENRIVSLEQPHVRPIVRGKRPNPTEFGQKVHLSVVEGYVYLEQTSWSNFNESTDLISCVKEYKRRFGVYPKAIMADKIYQTKHNKKYCKLRGIRLSGKALGRKSEEQKQAEIEQMHRDSCERNWVEGKNGLLKTRYGMSRVMSKLDCNAKSDLVFAILAMNAFRKLREDLLQFLFRYCYVKIIIPLY